MSLDQGDDFVKPIATTRDAFLGGRVHLTQPQKGFRAGIESVLLGASLSPASTNIADLGAGIGTAAIVALSHNPEATARLVELDPPTAELARANLEANNLASRAVVLNQSAIDPAHIRIAAGLEDNHFTSVLVNPPFYDADAGTKAPEKSRAAARHMPKSALESWLKTAAGLAAPGGEAIFVFPAEGLADLLAAFGTRFGNLTILPLAPRRGHAARRVLVRGIKGSRAPLTLLSSLVLHGEAGNEFADPAGAIFRGEQRLIW